MNTEYGVGTYGVRSTLSENERTGSGGWWVGQACVAKSDLTRSLPLAEPIVMGKLRQGPPNCGEFLELSQRA